MSLKEIEEFKKNFEQEIFFGKTKQEESPLPKIMNMKNLQLVQSSVSRNKKEVYRLRKSAGIFFNESAV